MQGKKKTTQVHSHPPSWKEDLNCTCVSYVPCVCVGCENFICACICTCICIVHENQALVSLLTACEYAVIHCLINWGDCDPQKKNDKYALPRISEITKM